jgi:hypothetical protein
MGLYRKMRYNYSSNARKCKRKPNCDYKEIVTPFFNKQQTKLESFPKEAIVSFIKKNGIYMYMYIG